jgi:hypothetical protein
MKSNRYFLLLAAIFGVAIFSLSGCAAKEQVAEAPASSAKVATSTTSATTTATATNAPAVAVAWSDLQGLSYDSRTHFFAGLKQHEAAVGAQISELTAKRAAMKSTTDTKGWDFAMKEMTDSQSYLHEMGEALNQATAETWDQQRDKVGQAWNRAQAAFEKVTASTTT